MADTSPASLASVQGIPVLVLPCLFAQQSHERASWDLPIDLDMVNQKGIRFQIYIEDLSPISRMNLYLRSGRGWYIASFQPPGSRMWHEISIWKEQMSMEETPEGWAHIDRVRISAWRGTHSNTRFYLSHMDVFGEEAEIALIRGESFLSKEPSAMKNLCEYTGILAAGLRDMGISYHLMSDLDLLHGYLQKKRLAILPYNPSMPESIQKEILAFLNNNGKLLSFYILPPDLRRAVGMAEGRHIRAEPSGLFSEIRLHPSSLPHAPCRVHQRSWNITECPILPGKSHVVALWHDHEGNPTSHAAIVGSNNCLHMTHVLLKDDPVAMRGLLMGMVDHWLPGTAPMAMANLMDSLFQGKDLKEGPWTIKESHHIQESRELEQEALRLTAQGDIRQALEIARRGRDKLIEGFCRGQAPLAHEHRAFWCHSALGVDGMSWEEAIRRLADHGFNVILPNMLWAGTAYYPSKVLPQAPEVATKGDQLQQCLDACLSYGIACHVWKVNYNTGGRASQAFISRMKSEGRVQKLFNGDESPLWLCPSHPANQRLEIESMLELVKEYPIQGIHFDYIRYPHRDSCFCDGCKNRFRSYLGYAIENWPQGTRTDPVLREAWMQFRRDQITTVVRQVHEQAKQIRSDIQISAAVFKDWPLDRDSVGQDWKLWCDKKYLDFICPMNYTEDNWQFENWLQKQKAWCGDVPSYPGIGYSTWGIDGDIPRLIQQVLLTREYHTGGFTVFNYGSREARDLLAYCVMGITAPPHRPSSWKVPSSPHPMRLAANTLD